LRRDEGSDSKQHRADPEPARERQAGATGVIHRELLGFGGRQKRLVFYSNYAGSLAAAPGKSVLSLFSQLAFRYAVYLPADLPPDRGAEVAFAGRSNAGKSTAINALANRKKLAFVSKTPGRTQALVFFDLGGHRHLVDLPGYGYAAVPGREQDRWTELISAYITQRKALKLLVLVADARQGITSHDRYLLDWLAPTGKPVHVLLTKADKLTRRESEQALAAAATAIAGYRNGISVQLFSGLRKTGVQQAQAEIAKWLKQ
jgi:GTP-binding protein